MRDLRTFIFSLVAIALLGFAATASADDDDPPSVASLGATEVTSTSAYLHAGVNPNGESTLYHFEYGTTTAYGSQTPPASAGGGHSWRLASARVENLAASTTYHFRIVATNEEGTRRGSDRTFTTEAAPVSDDGPDPPPAPGGNPDGPPASNEPSAPDPPSRSGKTVGVAPHSGLVLIRPRGSTDFTPLASGSELPYGSQVDARQGSLNLTSTLPSGQTQTGLFGAGRFVVRKGRRGYVNLRLRGPVCPAGARRRPKKSAVRAQASRRGGRKLWGRDRGGRFRTHGRNSHATVRGTRWVVIDGCAGTLTRVSEGAVMVRDFAKRKRTLVEAGERYLARPRR